MANDTSKLRASSRRLIARVRPARGYAGIPVAWLGILVLLTATGASSSHASGQETWVRVDTGASTLTVMRGEQVVASFPDIAVGRGGVSKERRRGDHKTPLGEFRIVKVKEPSQYHRFFIIDYPDEPRARQARDAGEIDEPTFQAIRSAGRAGRLPPQDTPLGGNLGIHGLGRGDPLIHESFHWTQGCVAVTNEQIDRLAELVRVGTRVVID